MYETKPYFYGTGRRKDSVARVRVYTGTGKVTINDRCLLYTSDAADEEDSVDLGGRRIIKKKTRKIE